MNSQYVRIKREKTTFFFECDSKDTVDSLKTRMKSFMKLESNEMRLYLGKRLLDDKSNLHDQDVRNDCQLDLFIKKQTGEWEDTILLQQHMQQQEELLAQLRAQEKEREKAEKEAKGGKK